MPTAPESRVLLCADEPAAVADVRGVLEQAGHAVGWQSLGDPGPDGPPAYDLVVVEGSRQAGAALRFCRRLRARLGDAFVPILFVTGDHSPTARLASFEGGADTYLPRPFAPGELLAQVGAFLRIKGLHDRLADQTAEVHRINQRLGQAHQRIDRELGLARRLQRSFLPQVLPELPGVRFAVHYRPCDQVGGDFYDAFRLDEDHVGFYVADAMGHGVPASLLTIFIKKGVRAKEIFGSAYRLVPPDEVLQRLNRDLVEQGLAEHPFITMVYALFNFRDGTLHFARAGHPHPLYVPAAGAPELWQVPGSLLGVFETRFTAQARHLRPGDKLLFYSDGVEALSFEGHPPGSASLLACAARYRVLPLPEFLDRLSGDLFRQAKHPDDWTVLGLEMKIGN
jgi:serine phosphatase RsbU (regulator of sigma subunit)/CheY-like chemotaxis protein